MTEKKYNEKVARLLASHSNYLSTRANEDFCNKHGLVRFQNRIFCGCFLCPADRSIQDEIMKLNVEEIFK